MNFKKSPIKITSKVAIEEDSYIVDEIEVKLLNKSKSGVYEIRNLQTGKYYIGQSRDLEKRMKAHFYKLDKGIHPISELQWDYDIHGRSGFEFRVIIFCLPSQLTFHENILIKTLNPYYNVHKIH